MIKIESVSLYVCLFIGLVTGHGYMTDPPDRIAPWLVSNAEFSGGINNQYCYRGTKFSKINKFYN